MSIETFSELTFLLTEAKKFSKKHLDILRAKLGNSALLPPPEKKEQPLSGIDLIKAIRAGKAPRPSREELKSIFQKIRLDRLSLSATQAKGQERKVIKGGQAVPEQEIAPETSTAVDLDKPTIIAIPPHMEEKAGTCVHCKTRPAKFARVVPSELRGEPYIDPQAEKELKSRPGNEGVNFAEVHAVPPDAFVTTTNKSSTKTGSFTSTQKRVMTFDTRSGLHKQALKKAGFATGEVFDDTRKEHLERRATHLKKFRAETSAARAKLPYYMDGEEPNGRQHIDEYVLFRAFPINKKDPSKNVDVDFTNPEHLNKFNATKAEVIAERPVEEGSEREEELVLRRAGFQTRGTSKVYDPGNPDHVARYHKAASSILGDKYVSIGVPELHMRRHRVTELGPRAERVCDSPSCLQQAGIDPQNLPPVRATGSTRRGNVTDVAFRPGTTHIISFHPLITTDPKSQEVNKLLYGVYSKQDLAVQRREQRKKAKGTVVDPRGEHKAGEVRTSIYPQAMERTASAQRLATDGHIVRTDEIGTNKLELAIPHDADYLASLSELSRGRASFELLKAENIRQQKTKAEQGSVKPRVRSRETKVRQPRTTPAGFGSTSSTGQVAGIKHMAMGRAETDPDVKELRTIETPEEKEAVVKALQTYRAASAASLARLSPLLQDIEDTETTPPPSNKGK